MNRIFLISALVTLFVVVDPIGLAPTFLAVTEGLSDNHRRQRREKIGIADTNECTAGPTQQQRPRQGRENTGNDITGNPVFELADAKKLCRPTVAAKRIEITSP